MIVTALIISLIVLAIHYTFQKGEIFGVVTEIGECHIPEKFHKPLFGCPICMCPWYGIPVYFIGYWMNIAEFSDIRAQFIGFVIAIAMGLNVIYSKIGKDE